jgi:hypothetical protein
LNFYLAYVPSEFENTDVISIQADGKQIDQLAGTMLNSIEMRPKTLCSNFGTKGYYSLYKVVTSYFEHSSNDMNITIAINNQRTIGVNEIGFEYQVDDMMGLILVSAQQQLLSASSIFPSINISVKNNSMPTVPLVVSSETESSNLLTSSIT